MSLSETISQLDDNESIRFAKHPMGINVTIKKGDHPKNNKTIFLTFLKKDLEKGSFDYLAFEVDRALSIIRKSTDHHTRK